MRLSEWFKQNDKSEVGLATSLFISFLIVAAGVVYLVINNNREQPAPVETLRHRCDSEYGVYVEGMTNTDNEVTQFSLCIPERAFECIDVE